LRSPLLLLPTAGLTALTTQLRLRESAAADDDDDAEASDGAFGLCEPRLTQSRVQGHLTTLLGSELLGRELLLGSECAAAARAVVASPFALMMPSAPMPFALIPSALTPCSARSSHA